MNKFIKELRRREVFRSAGLYVGICWILIEVSSVVLPTFDAPEWVLRAIIIVAVIGFPITLVLAWVFDLTGEGIKVQEEATEPVAAPLGSRKMDFVVIGVLSVALVISIYMNVTREVAPLEQPDPVAVLIADFDNRTGDSLFDGSLEQALQIGIEVAPFISTYVRASAQEIANEIRPGNKLDLATARLVSVREGINMVLAGSISAEGGGYEIVLAAVEPQEGTIIAEASVSAKDKGGVLMSMGMVTNDLVEELGGDTLEEDRVFASDTFTAASLEAVKSYTQAQELQHQGQDELAIDLYRRAVEQDPNFTRAYSGWALSATYLGRTDEADPLWQKALANLDRVTERERLRTLGLYYSIVTRNYQKALESYQSLVDKYPASDIGHNNLAVLHFLSLNFDAALLAGRNVLALYPSSAMYQTNYALFAMYASDFETSEIEARKVLENQPDYYKAWLPIAINALVTDNTAAAILAYENMAAANELAVSTAALGIADTHIYAGHFAAARESLQSSMEESLASGNKYGTATRYMVLAHALENEGDLAAAVAMSKEALAVSGGEPWVIPAALTYIKAGEIEAAAEIAESLRNELQPQSRAYGLLLDGLISNHAGENIAAIEQLTGAVELADLWLVRFYLGQLYLERGAYAEALDEFSICNERRGEAAALFLDDLPTYRYVAPLYYWLARAQQESGMSKAAAENFRKFIALRPNGGDLVEDASARLP